MQKKANVVVIVIQRNDSINAIRSMLFGELSRVRTKEIPYLGYLERLGHRKTKQSGQRRIEQIARGRAERSGAPPPVAQKPHTPLVLLAPPLSKIEALAYRARRSLAQIVRATVSFF